MADVFFRVPEDSNLWAERPRAKPRALCAEQSSRASRAWRAEEQAPPQPGGGHSRRAALMTLLLQLQPDPVSLWFLEPARPGGVSST